MRSTAGPRPRRVQAYAVLLAHDDEAQPRAEMSLRARRPAGVNSHGSDGSSSSISGK